MLTLYRFYINDATENLEFDLFQLDKETFSLLFLCLNKESLLKDIPSQIKQQSLAVENNITKQLYADYSAFKSVLFQNLIQRNPDRDQLELFKKTQKLLDRFLFIFFAEDRGLLHPNTVRGWLKDWEDLREKDYYVPLYDHYKKFFGYLNLGHKSQRHDIFAYNGGLFAPDDILDSIQIDDVILYKHTRILSNYDFETEVDVNILGHIFEHSLNEIEELQAKLEGSDVEKEKTKRKKDGIFYTPRYITKYIVESTVGKLCQDKKAEIKLLEQDYFPGQKKAYRRKLIDNLNSYREWLLQLTICDPACGSGAFLNAALEFLISEHRLLDELTAKLLSASLVHADISNQILEHNLFGVDINDEAVEIAKLSLWLRTASKERKLSNLSNNIKVGNSLIYDPIIAGSKAFNWENEFPEIFEKGGFDVIIGNPPYGASFNKNEKNFIIDHFSTYKYKFESYAYFIEKGIQLLRSFGIISYITPEVWLSLENSYPIRKYLSENVDLVNINVIGESAFTGAIVKTIIFTAIKNTSSSNLTILNGKDEWLIDFGFWKNHPLKKIEYRVRPEQITVVNKIENYGTLLSQLGEVIQGITPYDKYRGQDPNLIKSRGYHSNIKKDETYDKWLNGEDISRFSLSWSGEWLSYGL